MVVFFLCCFNQYGVESACKTTAARLLSTAFLKTVESDRRSFFCEQKGFFSCSLCPLEADVEMRSAPNYMVNRQRVYKKNK